MSELYIDSRAGSRIPKLVVSKHQVGVPYLPAFRAEATNNLGNVHLGRSRKKLLASIWEDFLIAWSLSSLYVCTILDSMSTTSTAVTFALRTSTIPASATLQGSSAYRGLDENRALHGQFLMQDLFRR